MERIETIDVDSLREKLAKYNQEHLLDFWSQLTSDAERRQLFDELQALNLSEISQYFKNCSSELNQTTETSSIDDRLAPVPDSVHGSIVRTNEETLKSYENEGIYRIICPHPKYTKMGY